jgi:23S rRNA (guanine2445-N2)-methyltransferase / 23S rRNA (guanine2069-N7)-methyltransferase
MTHSFFAQSPRFVEELLADEIRSLGGEAVKPAPLGVSFSGRIETAYRVCLWSRIANRVLLPIAVFPASTPEELYEGARNVPWFDHFDLGRTFAVDSSVTASEITNADYAALKVKDAAADAFRDRFGSRPDVDVKRPDITINLRIYRNTATVSLDLSGGSLHKRGYRAASGPATLKENIAAAVLLRAGWPEIAREGGAFIDPMCGTGTLPIEAALIAADIAPGLFRTRWGFSAWTQHLPAVYRNLVREADERRLDGLARMPAVFGFDRDRRAVAAALRNAQQAGFGERRLLIAEKELRSVTPPVAARPGLVAVNPPSGERLGETERLVPLYRDLGRVLDERFRGWKAAVLTGNEELSRSVGLRPLKVNTLYNGPIKCTLALFEPGREDEKVQEKDRRSEREPREFSRPKTDRPLPMGDRLPEKLPARQRQTESGRPAPDTARPESLERGIRERTRMPADRADESGRRQRESREVPAGDGRDERRGRKPDRTEGVDRRARESHEPAAFDPSRQETERGPSPGLEMLRNRLDKNRKHIGKWAHKNDVRCYRLYDADLPEYNAAIDIYEEKWVHLQEYAAPAEIPEEKAAARMAELIGVIPGRLAIKPEHLFVKQRRRQKGSEQYEKLAETGEFHEVSEGGLRFLVNFTDYLDTGLFLDHRITRSMIRDLANGARFLNLFAYTCTATVYAAAGGTVSTVSVDNSNRYLEWGRRNMELNGFTGPNHRFVREDCLKWLKEATETYDLIFLDPPTFSNSRRMAGTLDIQRDHASLIRSAARLLAPDGVLIFSNNFRQFRIEADALPRLEIKEITKETIPRDFVRNPRIHNAWLITRKKRG